MMTEKSREMRLFSPEGERLYLTAQERKYFLAATEEEDRENKLFCQTLYYTGCRPSEALELSPGRVSIGEKQIVFRSLKKRKRDSRGRKKLPEFRAVPVPKPLIDGFDYVFDIRRKRRKSEGLEDLLWTMSRPTAYRLVKRVMNRANIKGKQATGKGIRHAFGIALLSGSNPNFSSVKFFADRGAGHAAVVSYRKWPATKSLRKNPLTQRVSFFDYRRKNSLYF